MARVAKEIDRRRIAALKKKIKSSQYIFRAVHSIAQRLTHHLFAEYD